MTLGLRALHIAMKLGNVLAVHFRACPSQQRVAAYFLLYWLHFAIKYIEFSTAVLLLHDNSSFACSRMYAFGA